MGAARPMATQSPGTVGAWRYEPPSVGEAKAFLRHAVSVHGGPFEREAIVSWVLERFPAADPLLIDGLTLAATVNDPRRQHFPEPPDLMFRLDDGRLQQYDASIHGRWTKSGRLRMVSALQSVGASGSPPAASLI